MVHISMIMLMHPIAFIHWTIYQIELRRCLMQSIKFNQSIHAIRFHCHCRLSHLLDVIVCRSYSSDATLFDHVIGREINATHRRNADETKRSLLNGEESRKFGAVCICGRSIVRNRRFPSQIHKTIIHIYTSLRISKAKCSNVAGGIFYVA